MQLVKPGMPKKPKMVDDLALSSKSGSTPGATNRPASRLDTLLIIMVMILPAIDDWLTGMRTWISWIPDTLERKWTSWRPIL